MQSSAISNAVTILITEMDIVKAINATTGWQTENRDEPAFVYHQLLRNALFQPAFGSLTREDRIALMKKLSHRTHFTEGVTKAKAMEYYYLSGDAYFKDGYVQGLEGGIVNMTKPMERYRAAIDEVAKNCDPPAALQDIGNDLLFDAEMKKATTPHSK